MLFSGMRVDDGRVRYLSSLVYTTYIFGNHVQSFGTDCSPR